MTRVQFGRSVLCVALGLGLWATALTGAAAGPWQIHRQPLPPGARRGLLNFKTPLRSVPSPQGHVLRAVLKNLSVAVYGGQDGFCAIQLRNGTRGWVVAPAVREAAPLRGDTF